ncbi:hypothetical protein V4F39_07685 [Aquincola sp. MAHUQ-54]|uniref:Uncharacterized protein n=1 Tax=Aquincola agrisoli TaxID=3119538 RepID=A0AAW9QEL1_9BURK
MEIDWTRARQRRACIGRSDPLAQRRRQPSRLSAPQATLRQTICVDREIPKWCQALEAAEAALVMRLGEFDPV